MWPFKQKTLQDRLDEATAEYEALNEHMRGLESVPRSWVERGIKLGTEINLLEIKLKRKETPNAN